MVCVCMQACRIRLPRLWWMDQVNATLQTPSRAHWTPNGISTMTCESPVPLLTTNTLSQFSRMWSFNNHFPIDFLFYLYLNVWIKMYIFFALFNNSLILWPLFLRKKNLVLCRCLFQQGTLYIWANMIPPTSLGDNNSHWYQTVLINMA